MLQKPLPCFQRQIRHGSKIGNALMIDPLHDLTPAKSLQTDLLKQQFQLTSVQSGKGYVGWSRAASPFLKS